MEDKANKPTELTGTAEMHGYSSMEAIAHTKANFAGQHLLAAGRFARIVEEVESKNIGGSSADPFFQEIIAYVPATVLVSAAALEAYINELFVDGPAYHFPEYAGEHSADLWELLWNEIKGKKSTLDKYNLALRLKDQARFTKDPNQPQNQPFLSAMLLIDIRNAFMHFKPQWSHEEEKLHHQIANRLLKEPVSSSPFGSNSPLFPTDFMSHDMARWAVKTAWQFIEAFSRRSGVLNKYAYMVDDVNPGYPTWPIP